MGKRSSRHRHTEAPVAPVAAPPARIMPSPARALRATSIAVGDFASIGTRPMSPRTAYAVDTAYACVRLIADATARAEWGEWRGTEELPPSRIVRRPSARMTRREWTWLVAATLALYNFCLLELVGTDSEGVPESLVPISPERVSTDGSQLLVDGAPVNPSRYYLMRRSVLPAVTLTEAAILAVARTYLAAGLAASAYTADWWTNGGAPVTVLTTDQVITDDDAAMYGERWVERRQLGPSVPAVMGKGLKAEAFGADMGTAAADSAAADISAAITRYFGVPPHLVAAERSGGASLTYTTTEQEGVDFARYTVSAYSETIADCISELLPGDYVTGRVCRLSLKHLTVPEMGARFAAWASAIGAGWMTIDEVREAEGLPPMAATEAPA